MFQTFNSITPEICTWLLSISVRVFGVVGVALVAMLLLRKQSAAFRHHIWLAVTLCSVLLPVLSYCLPSLTLLPDVGLWDVSLQNTSVSFATESASSGEPVLTAYGHEVGEEGVMKQNLVGPQDRAAIAPTVDQNMNQIFPSISTLLISLWALVGLSILAFPIIGSIKVHHSHKRASEPDSEMLKIHQLLVDRLEIQRKVVLKVANEDVMPMTFGLFRPVVVLPALAKSWSPDRLRMVLLHELAHVARKDCAWQWLCTLASAVYWFHPGMWIVSRRLYAEREAACDDVVLNAGHVGSSYAAELLDVSTGCRRDALAMCAGIAMSRSHRLEHRVKSILNSNTDRASLSLGNAVMVLGICVILTCILSVISPAVAADIKTIEPESENVQLALESKALVSPEKSAVTVNEERAWGTSQQGVRIRIRSEKSQWNTSETPEFLLDVRNKSESAFYYPPRSSSCSIELDGNWYWQRMTTEYGTKLERGDEKIGGITILLEANGKWLPKNVETKPFELLPGKHTIRVALARDSEFPLKEPISNPLEFTINDDDGASAKKIPSEQVADDVEDAAPAKRNPGLLGHIYTANRDGTGLKLLADDSLLDGYTFLGDSGWSPDGKWIAIGATPYPGRGYSNSHIVKLCVDGPDKGQKMDLNCGLAPSWSPDNKQIAFLLNGKNPLEAKAGLWVMDADGTNRRRLGYAMHPQWSPDGKSILSVSGHKLPRKFLLFDVETGKRTELLKNHEGIGLPTWAPDSKRFAATINHNGEQVLGVFEAIESPVSFVEVWNGGDWTGGFDGTWPAWSPDGKTIAFTNYNDGVSAIQLVEPKANATPDSLNFAPAGTNVMFVAWKPDSKGLSFSLLGDGLIEFEK